MEKMFELEEQIKKWRENLFASQSFENKDIDELESHLRDEIDELSSTKLLPEEVFVIAVNRLGHIDGLVGEYAKINPEKRSENRFIPMVLGIFYYLINNLPIHPYYFLYHAKPLHLY